MILQCQVKKLYKEHEWKHSYFDLSKINQALRERILSLNHVLAYLVFL